MTKEQIREQVTAYIKTSRAILEAIIEAGEQGIPSGHLYAMCMGKMSLETYNHIIGTLTQGNLITDKGHLLRATELTRMNNPSQQ